MASSTRSAGISSLPGTSTGTSRPSHLPPADLHGRQLTHALGVAGEFLDGGQEHPRIVAETRRGLLLAIVQR